MSIPQKIQKFLEKNKTKYEPNKIKYFIANFEKTAYKTKVTKITIATNSVPGWNEIDAVQLVGTK